MHISASVFIKDEKTRGMVGGHRPGEASFVLKTTATLDSSELAMGYLFQGRHEMLVDLSRFNTLITMLARCTTWPLSFIFDDFHTSILTSAPFAVRRNRGGTDDIFLSTAVDTPWGG
jgi:hypothetical protein